MGMMRMVILPKAVGDNNKVYARWILLDMASHNKIGAQPADDAPKKDSLLRMRTQIPLAVFGANNAVVGKERPCLLGNDNKITDTSTSNATVIGFGATASCS